MTSRLMPTYVLWTLSPGTELLEWTPPMRVAAQIVVGSSAQPMRGRPSAPLDELHHVIETVLKCIRCDNAPRLKNVQTSAHEEYFIQLRVQGSEFSSRSERNFIHPEGD